MSERSRLVVQRVHNNNIVHALDAAGRSVVVTGNGVGFGASRGMLVDPSRVDGIYVPRAGTDASAAAGILAEIPTNVVACARRIVSEAQERLGLPRTDVLLIPIADHLHQAERRARRGITIDLPLTWEVSVLYPDELAMGRRVLDIVHDALQVELPHDEATAFAMHFVSNHFSRAGIDRTVAMTQSISSALDIIEENGARLDRSGPAVARFVTHLRFLFVRLADGQAVPEAPPFVREALTASYPQVLAVAEEIAADLARAWKRDIGDDEIAYIGLHVHRLLAAPSPAPERSTR